MSGDDDILIDLLHEADTAGGALAAGESPPTEIAVRAITLFRRRRRMKAVGGTAAFLALALVTWMQWTRPASPDSVVHRANQPISAEPEYSELDIDAIRAELAALRQEAELRQRVVDALEQRQRAAQLLREEKRLRLAAADAEQSLDIDMKCETEVAARLTLHYARQLEQLPGRSIDAANEFKRVVALFPATAAAREARSRL